MEKSMTDAELNWFVRKNFDQLARVIAADGYLRPAFEAKLSCASIQRGTHIDTLARDAPKRRSRRNLPTISS